MNEQIRKQAWYPIVYMFVVTAVFSTVLIGLSRLTRERVEANQRIAFERTVLEALGMDVGDMSRSQVHDRFVASIAEPTDNTAGAYRWMEDGRLKGYALPIAGQGFWAPIKGVLGIEPDAQTVTGIAFYEQSETPGLGAEITTNEFRSQFIGKTIDREIPYMSIRPVAAPLDEHSVHAITGATQTSTRLEKFLRADLAAWVDAMHGDGAGEGDR